ncbi:MAG: lysylphosphatidylglycerol synthase transmembrane domain-containing protein [Pirellulales bacterium]
MTRSAKTHRRALVWILRIGALLLVGWFVAGSVRGAIGQLRQHEWDLHPAWLIFSGALYGMSLLPQGWFWDRTLAALGYPTPLIATLRAYLLGHLGKYVPGKAISIILRVAGIRRWVPSMRIALLSAIIETLTMMAVGALLAAATTGLVLHLDPIIWLAALGMAGVSLVPTLPPTAKLLARIGNPQTSAVHDDDTESSATDEPNIELAGVNYRLLASGWAAACVCWLFIALSLWATLRALGISEFSPVHDLPLLIAAVTFSVVAGFLSQLPAGLGVRDALLMQLLVPVCGEANALVVAVLMRLVWLVSEIIVCGILYIGSGRQKTTA